MIVLLCLLAFSEKTFGTLGAGGPVSELQANMDVKKLHLRLKIDPEQEQIFGTAIWQVQLQNPSLKRLEWDLFSELKVGEVRADATKLAFQQSGHKLFVDLPTADRREWQIEIDYAGTPLEAVRPPWRGGFTWTKTDQDVPWVAVSCQGEGAKVWFPSKDQMGDKIEGLTLEFTVPAGLYCAANGLLTSRSPAAPGWETFTWESKYPISAYNISFGLGPYGIDEAVFTDEDGRETPVIFYYITPHQKADQRPDDPRDFATKRSDLIEEFKKYLAFYASHYGPFPFHEEKAGIVQTPYLGMEHQTINAYGNHYIMEGDYDWLLLHELGHEWWGNKVSLADWRDFWIHEGICTYSTAVYLETTQGLEVALTHLEGLRQQLSNKKPIVGEKNASTTDSYTLDVYYKGALMLHSLRYLLGKATVDKILYEFAMAPSGTYLHPVDTQDFIQLAESIADRELDWFFQHYLYQADLPILQSKLKGNQLQLSWDSPKFQMPVEVRILYNGASRLHRVTMADGKGTLKVPRGAQYTVDPQNWILKSHP